MIICPIPFDGLRWFSMNSSFNQRRKSGLMSVSISNMFRGVRIISY